MKISVNNHPHKPAVKTIAFGKIYTHLPSGEIVICTDAKGRQGIRLADLPTTWTFVELQNYELFKGELTISNDS